MHLTFHHLSDITARAVNCQPQYSKEQLQREIISRIFIFIRISAICFTDSTKYFIQISQQMQVLQNIFQE